MGTWAAFVELTQTAETIDGDITAELFYEAANTTDNLDLNGMVPVLDFTQEWTEASRGYNRLFNRSVGTASWRTARSFRHDRVRRRQRPRHRQGPRLLAAPAPMLTRPTAAEPDVACTGLSCSSRC